MNTTPRINLWVVSLLLGSSTLSHAAVPIERRSLSQPSSNTPVAPVATAPALEQPSILWQLTQQVQQLQEEVRMLRGRGESQEQQVEQMEKQLQSRFVDFDQRLDQLREQLNTLRGDDAIDLSADSTDISSAESNVIPPPPIGASTTTPAKTSTTSTAEQNAYIAAYDAYKAGGTAQAIVAMEKFMQDYPNSVYIPNAHYWLGEFHLALNPPSFLNAKKEFEVVMSTYPRSARAAAAIYRLASMAEVEKRSDEATRLMNIILNDYPTSSEAAYARDFMSKRAN
ncbi:MAG: YbgF trimerization domain-containing protein [Pseudomonadota bacterium]|nr:YbgF trimerization domain-containing protein [Pseudomonadota bacterium]